MEVNRSLTHGPTLGPTSPRRDARLGRSVTLGLAVLLAAGLLAPLAAAQGQPGISIDQIDTGGFPTTKASVTVRDANGVPVPDLQTGAFEVVEDGRYSFPPDSLSTQVNPDANVSIALVVDLSGSMEGAPLEQAQEASRNLLDALLDRDADPDRVAFFGINRMVKPDDLALDEAVEVPFGNDKNKVLNVVNFLTVEGNQPTPLYDALFRVVKLTAQQPGRRAIIIISDGVDKVSTLQADDPITEANRNNIPVFPISLSTNQVDSDYLRRLAVRTGGVYREAPSPEEFTPLFQEVLDQLKLQYNLEYQSRLAKDGQPHSLLVRVRSPLATGFDETKFVLAAAPVAGATAVTASDVATLATTTAGEPVVATVAAAATAVPAEEGGFQEMIDDVTTFVEDNPLPSALIGVAVLLLIILVVLLVVWLRRRNAAAREAEGAYSTAAGGDDWGVSMPSAPAVGNAPPGYGGSGVPAAGSFKTSPKGSALPTMAEGSVGGAPTAAPTVGPGAAPPYGQPGMGAPYGAPVGGVPPPYAPPPYSPAAPPPGGGASGAAGETVVLKRAPKHMAMLINRKDPTRRHDLLESTDIGRSQGNTIVIPDSTVSRQHAKIRLEDEAFRLFDLGSANGTFVNGKRVEEPVTLAENDLVRFGDAEYTFKQLS